MNTWLLLPVRGLSEGKTRLARALDVPTRTRLNEALFRRTLAIGAALFPPSRILVVSRDTAVRTIATDLGFATLEESDGAGLNGALTEAAAFARDAGADAVLSLASDLPRLTTDDLAALLDLRRSHGVAIAPDEPSEGTNALLLARPGVIAYRYGIGSFAAHTGLARAAGIEPAILHRPGLSFDLDTEAEFGSLGASELAALGIAAPR